MKFSRIWIKVKCILIENKELYQKTRRKQETLSEIRWKSSTSTSYKQSRLDFGLISVCQPNFVDASAFCHREIGANALHDSRPKGLDYIKRHFIDGEATFHLKKLLLYFKKQLLDYKTLANAHRRNQKKCNSLRKTLLILEFASNSTANRNLISLMFFIRWIKIINRSECVEFPTRRR